MVGAATVHFKCPHCDALYQVVKAEAGPETSIDGEIPCRICGGPLAARDGEFVLKYFLLRKAGRQQAWGKGVRPCMAARVPPDPKSGVRSAAHRRQHRQAAGAVAELG